MSESPDGLEQSYRRYTRLFPPSYRSAREDEMVAVLMEASAPGQSRTSLPEALDLLGSAARVWLPYALGPDRASRRTAAAVLAVLLPTAFMYGAGLSVRVITSLPPAAVPGYLSSDRYWVVWLAWTVVNLLLLVRAPRWALAIALLAISVYVPLMAYSLWQFGPNPFAPAVGWLLVQAVTVALLLYPARVRRGFALVSRWSQIGVGVLAFGFGLSHYWWSTNRGSSAVWLLVLLTALAGLVMMRTPAGRVIVPVLGGVAAFAVVTRVWANNIRWYDHAGFGWVQLPDIVLLVAVPILTLTLLRLVGEGVDRVWPRGQDAAGRAAAPDAP